MKNFKLWDRVLGSVVFAIAMVTYALTIEPTASFWDCPEFITTAFKLEVGHPPGAPFFMLTGKFFSLFASDPTQVAYCINMLSAFLSALTILFLFWTITLLAKRLIVGKNIDGSKNEISLSQSIIILGSGLIGSLAYTFSDTFWFSAVEAEVYAYSSFLTAIVFWLILKWEEKADEEGSDKYLILITYLMGLSIGVHLLNLLTIPAIVLVYYFRKYEASIKGTLIALVVSFAILGFVLYGLIPGFISLAGHVELFFVNKLGLPFNSGALFYCMLTVGVLVWSIIELYKEKVNYRLIKVSSLLAICLMGLPFIMGNLWIGLFIVAAILIYFIKIKEDLNIRMLSTIMVCLSMMLLGYTTYAVIVVRSAANPPMDQNSPDNVFALKTYLNREQYGDRPLFYGQYYSSEPALKIEGNYCRTKITEGEKTYGIKEKTSPNEKDEYVVTGTKYSVEYDSNMKTLFPRMHSNSGGHAQAYESWVNVKGKKVPYDQCGQKVMVKLPTFGENLEFFFKYQLNYMYWRYFMWNFSGRQNDIQGHGDIINGNWITGINAIDRFMVGDQSNLPEAYASNKGRNVYYMLPLLLGILGIAFQVQRKEKCKQTFWITMTLFFMTGIAIVLYLNQGPAEPRERDYAYAGSFYAFCIWIGFGVAGLAELLKGTKLNSTICAVLATLVALPAPLIMASENWDDHDRSDRYVVKDFGKNYFNSCAANAIIFTNGDNDTFPLWYLQETEGDSVAIDKRVCNLSYLQTDWYIDQMRRPAYKSEALPITWERKDYAEGTRSIVYLKEIIKDPIDLKKALDFLLANPAKDPNNKLKQDYIPGRIFSLPVNKDNLVKQGAIREEDKDKIADFMIIDLSHKSYITKSEVMILEMLANNNWERPIYYAVTVGSEMYLNMQKYFQLEGLSYRIVPYKDGGKNGITNTDIMYNNMMNKFQFGNIDTKGDIYLDENTLRMCRAHRQMFSELIGALIKEGKKEKAIKALDYCLEMIPHKNVPHNFSSTDFVEQYYAVGEISKGKELANIILDESEAKLKWISTLSKNHVRGASDEIGRNLLSIQQIGITANNNLDYELFNRCSNLIDKYYYLYR